MLSIYQNLPLEKEHREIRLIKILPSDDEAGPICCNIEKSSLDWNPQYTAPSYVWGSREDPTTIFVNGSECEVTQNLGLALKNIRKVWGQITLWVDAICINQD